MKRCLFLSIVIVCGGCISIGGPFFHAKPDYTKLPVDVMKEVALEIEQGVQKGEREPNIADRGGIVLSTDAIKQAIRTRAARSELLNEFLNSGHACEGRTGLISILRTKDYKKSASSRQRDRDALLIMSENSNRWAIYEGIVDASKLTPGSLSAIQAVFHDARVQCMTQGQKYEDASGAVQVK